MADDNQIVNRIVNTHQFEAWNGYEGRHWAEHQSRYDALNDPANDPLLNAARIRDTDSVLDIGCGNGRLTRLAARTAQRAVGVDLSTPMLERARASAAEEHLTNVTHIQADAQVHPFETASFDVALSRFGIMFFADPVAAFANIGRALRPGGRLAFVCPQSIDRLDQSTKRTPASTSRPATGWSPPPGRARTPQTTPDRSCRMPRAGACWSVSGPDGCRRTGLHPQVHWRPISAQARPGPP